MVDSISTIAVRGIVRSQGDDNVNYTTKQDICTYRLTRRYFHFQVSWIRKGDLHILTVGILTYTNDQRFQTLHSDGTDEWTLRITPTQVHDSGTYECQVSTEPKISLGFKLNVVSKYRSGSGLREF